MLVKLRNEGLFASKFPDSLSCRLCQSVFNDILSKLRSFNAYVTQDSSLEDKVRNSLSYLSDTEFHQYFGPITNRYLPGTTDAVELSTSIIDYFSNTYNVDFEFHGIRDADRNIILPNHKEIETIAIWYRIYQPGSKCGLPHRDADFWAIDQLPTLPAGNFSRTKLWMPILGCTKDNSLRVWPYSHNLDLQSDYTAGDKKRPFISEEKLSRMNDYVVPSCLQGEYTLFDDLTVHHGPKNNNQTNDGFRISLETTLLLKKECSSH
jgi:hypothetical protein